MTDRLANASWSHIKFPDAALQAAIPNNLYTELQEAPKELNVTCKGLVQLSDPASTNHGQRERRAPRERYRVKSILVVVASVDISTVDIAKDRDHLLCPISC